jgi:hypothetical protein
MPRHTSSPLRFAIPDDAWSGAPGDPEDGRLLCTAHINGTAFHAEAVPVEDAADGVQRGVDPISESRLSGLAAELDAPGFKTTPIRGRDYVVFLTPFGR